MVLGPICRGGYTPDIGHAFSNHSYFRACDQFSSSSVQRARGLDGEKKKEERKKKKKKEEESVVKYVRRQLYRAASKERKAMPLRTNWP